MAKVLIYTKAECPYCDWAKDLLRNKNIAYSEIHIDLDPQKRDEMILRSGRKTVPQIFINDQSIGGFDDLSALSKTGELAKLLNQN